MPQESALGNHVKLAVAGNRRHGPRGLRGVAGVFLRNPEQPDISIGASCGNQIGSGLDGDAVNPYFLLLALLHAASALDVPYDDAAVIAGRNQPGGVGIREFDLLNRCDVSSQFASRGGMRIFKVVHIPDADHRVLATRSYRATVRTDSNTNHGSILEGTPIHLPRLDIQHTDYFVASAGHDELRPFSASVRHAVDIRCLTPNLSPGPPPQDGALGDVKNTD